MTYIIIGHFKGELVYLKGWYCPHYSPLNTVASAPT